MALIRRFVADESGSTIVDCGFTVFGIAFAMMFMTKTVGFGVHSVFAKVNFHLARL